MDARDEFEGWEVEDSDPWAEQLWRYRPTDGLIDQPADPGELTRLAEQQHARIRRLRWLDPLRQIGFGLGGIGLVGAFFGWWPGIAVFVVCLAGLVILWRLPTRLARRAHQRRAAVGYPVPSGMQNAVWAAHGAHRELTDLLADTKPAGMSLQWWRYWRLNRRVRSARHLLFDTLDELEYTKTIGRPDEWETVLKAMYTAARYPVQVLEQLTDSAASTDQ